VPIYFPYNTDTAGIGSSAVNVFQPVIVPVGERETNPHHLQWPASRTGASRTSYDQIDALRSLALTHGVGDREILRLAQPPMDPLTLSTWDRLEMRDGQLFATKYDVSYTPGECARLCSKIGSFRGNECIAFSRKWLKSDFGEHRDTTGRDKREETTSNFHGGGNFKYPAQCVFFGKMKATSGGALDVTNLCTTVQDWLLDPQGAPWGPSVTAATIAANGDSCQARHGLAKNNFKDRTRSWRLITHNALGRDSVGGFTPTGSASGDSQGGSPWPAATPTSPVQEGRRLLDNSTKVHQFFEPDGTSFWAHE